VDPRLLGLIWTSGLYIKQDDPTATTKHPAIPIMEINGYVDESDNQADFLAFLEWAILCMVIKAVEALDWNRQWLELRNNIHEHSKKRTALEIINRATPLGKVIQGSLA
jgi:hypothetical protein